MRIDFLPEPELEFGSGNHSDIRYGLKDYGPIGFSSGPNAETIRIGFVGTAATIEGVYDWMSRARGGVPERASKKPRFRFAFPGFGLESPFRCEWTTEPRLKRAVDPRKLEEALKARPKETAVKRVAELFMKECRYLDTTAKVDVIVCAPSGEVLQEFDVEDEVGEEDHDSYRKSSRERAALQVDFHDFLKAQSLTLNSPIQFIRPPTYTQSAKHTTSDGHRLQDPATRAWNFHTALYYKSGRTPWRLLRKVSDLESCFIGISFFRDQ
jgi:hypothetical protein